jgi:hypothetical protein
MFRDMKSIPCPIPEAELNRLYSEAKLTDQQIVDHLGGDTTVKRVRSWRKRFGIETINRTERHDVPPIEGRLKSLLVGSMLGDGRLSRGVHVTRFVENHAAYQSEYAEWKRQQWGSWVKHELKSVVWKKASGDFPGVRFETVSHVALNEWQEIFYPQPGPKVLVSPSPVVPLMKGDALALAIWYMDDGCAEWWPTLTMASVQRVVATQILDGFGLTAEWKPSSISKTTGCLVLKGEQNAERFLDLTRPYIPECMSYKLEPDFQGAHYQVRKAAPPEKLMEFAAAGVPIREIAKSLGVGATTVDRYLKGYGIEHERRVGRPKSL